MPPRRLQTMNIYGAFSLFALVILLYWIISELFTILFRFTGLPDERARFQVMSLLTGCGFTTKESEGFLSTRSRRRLVQITMLFGYVFNITIVSAFINVFLSMKQNQVQNFLVGILFPAVIVALVLVLARIPAVRSWTDRALERLAGRMMDQGASNTAMILDYIGSDSIVQVNLNHIPDEHRGKTLAESNLRAEQNIMVMLVERKGSKAVAATADTVFEPGDRLTLFGDYLTICRAFDAREYFSGQSAEEAES